MLYVQLYKDVPVNQKPAKIPDEWPAEVRPAVDDEPAPAGFVAMTSKEYSDYLDSKLPLYQEWKENLDIPGIREAKFEAIDQKTGKLIQAGFSFAGKDFSLSAQAQATYSGLYMIRDEPLLVFPVTVNTIDDLDVLQLKNADEVRAFYMTAVGTYRAHLDAGTALKDQVRVASNGAELNAIIDDR